MHERLGHDTHSFATRANTAFKRGGRRRLAGAAVAAVAILVLLALLGPDKEAVKRRFEYYGAPGELRIMPEISVDSGSDRTHQLPKSLQQPPPPADVQVEKDRDDPDAEETRPKPQEGKPTEIVPDDVVADGEKADQAQVELALPTQSNPDWFILHMVRPEYPVEASESERRMPVIFVKAAIFVGEDGQVQEKMILSTNGGPAFRAAVLKAIGEWLFGWRGDPAGGRWIEMTWNFRSPYFTPGAAGSR